MNEVNETPLVDPIHDDGSSFRGNAINEIALALTFDMFNFSKSATFQILKKMAGYDSFNKFLAEACDENILDFVPELVPDPKSENNAR